MPELEWERAVFMSGLDSFQNSLGYRFRNISLLRLALTHPSVAHETGGAVQHNQRLEFLGDAVLQLILTHELYEKFPSLGEGPLTKARAQMVNSRALAEHARRLGLGQHLIVSKGEEQTGGRTRSSALADGFEALVGAIFLDGGLGAAREFTLRQYRERFGELQVLPSLDNPKGELQELLQARSPEPPQYELISIAGPDHDREFECVVYHQRVELGRGKGKSKKIAESQAALRALDRLRHQEQQPAKTTACLKEPTPPEPGD
jgi:ribonuclease-3